MNRSTTVLLRDLDDEQKSREIQELPLSIFRQFSRKNNANRPRSSTSILRRSISDSVERNLCHRVGLHQACREGIVDVVRTLLHGSVPTINTLDEEGFAPLHYAARYDRATIVQLLINAGADLNVCSDGDNKFTTPLQIAARFNSPDTAHLLILHGADVAKQSNYGQQALHYAARRGNLKVVQVLLKEGNAKANATDNENSTPLHAASQEGKLNVVEILLQYGADPSLSDNDGYTAVHLAAKDGHDGVLEKLLSTGAQLFESFIYLLLPHWYFIFMMSLEGVTLPCPFCISLSRDPFQESLEKLSHPESRSEISNIRITKLFYLIIFHINYTRGFRCIHFSVFSYRLTENAETFPKPS